MSDKDIVVSSRENYESALERAEKAEARCRELSIQLETCRQHNATLREVGDQMLKDYQKTTLELERERRAAAEMRAALLFNTIAWRDRECLCDPHRIGTECHKHACIRRNEAALATDAGRDYVHRDDFEILVEALMEIEAHPDARHQIVQVCKRTIAAAHEKGIIS